MPTGKKPLVEIVDTKAETKEQADKAVRERLDFHQNLIYAVLVVTAVGFIAIVVAVFDIFIQYKLSETEKYNEYTQILQTQNDLITTEKNKNLQTQIEQLKSEVDNLWKSKYPIRR